MIWDKLSHFYDFFEKVYNGKCYKGIAEKIKEYVTEDDIVLECACGTGLLTLPMAQKCKKLIATDYSVGMLRQTKKKVAKYSNTKVRKASIFELPCKDGKFDVVVAANVIHLLDEPDKVISELKRVCKPNGKIILPTYINNEKKNSIFAAKLLSVLGVKFKRQFSLASYKQFITSHNITQVEYSVVEGRMPCAFAIITNC
ncbi:class I SAM-dependent methyltransferase [Frisingicoccus sp.]|uniref:class I SAM-dependent methyltransferase n=1 Tax=Frisingicoccus sp. TaxID=1918627 RepID=UPI003AB3EB41